MHDRDFAGTKKDNTGPIKISLGSIKDETDFAGASGTKHSGDKRSFGEMDDTKNDIPGPNKDDRDIAGASGTKRSGPNTIFSDCTKCDILGPNKGPRYLLVLSGCAICLLDLKHETLSKVDRRVHALPKMATLNLIDENLPVSAGLVRFGSAVSLIGGHRFVPITPLKHGGRKEITQNCEFYKYLLLRSFLMGTTSPSYRLTLERGDDGFVLSPYSECNNLSALKPKFWPAVVEVGGQVHIFESDPSGLVRPDFNGGWIFSHEVIRGDVLVQIPTKNLDMNHFIHRYLVLDPYIYAVAGPKCLLFDSRGTKWEIIERKGGDDDWLFAKCVFDILLLQGFSWKIGEIGVGDDMHYAVLWLEQNEGVTFAVVFLVTSTTGKIVSIQSMPDLFSVGSLTMPCMMLSGTIIKADEDSEGETLCLIINAYTPLDEDCNEYDGDRGAFLFIYTFKVKTLVKNVSEIPVEPSSLLQEFEFVSIDIQKGFVFKANADFDRKTGGFYSHLVGIQASFVDQSFVDRALHG